MSLANFKIASNLPTELKPAGEVFECWLQKHLGLPFFTLEMVLDGTDGRLASKDAILVMAHMISQGMLRSEFKVQFQDRTFCEGGFSNLDALNCEETVYNSSFEPVPVEHGKPVTVYMLHG